jgi:hypothetical protein
MQQGPEMITKTEASRRLRVKWERTRRRLEEIPGAFAARTGAPPATVAALAELVRENLDAQELEIEAQIILAGWGGSDDA